jgi:FkbM family methyltransferase
LSLLSRLFGRKAKTPAPPPPLLDLPALARTHGLTVEGVVHVGANQGGEVATYKAMGASRIVLVEANPGLAESLRRTFAGDLAITVAAVAAGEADGEADFHLTSFDQSSSLLKLKRHAEIYPEIVASGTIRVPVRRLDGVLAGLGLATARFDLLSLDIQGAELMALRGSPDLLARVSAVCCELCFEELYEGCALAPDIDAHLAKFGFTRVATTTPYHSSWGDGFYVRKG